MSFLMGSSDSKRQTKITAGVTENDAPTNEEGIPVPVVCGIRAVAVQWITPIIRYYQVAIRQKVSSGFFGSKKVTVGYNYYGDLAAAVCMGPVDVLTVIQVEGKVVWTGNMTRSGDYADVTIRDYGLMRIYWGTDTQSNDSLVLTDQAYPAFRGVCYVVFKDLYLGRDRAVAPSIRLTVTRYPRPSSRTTALGDANGTLPGAVIDEILTNKRFGLGLSPSLLLASSYGALDGSMISQSFRFSPFFTSPVTTREALASILTYYDGWARITGSQMEVGYFAHGDLDTSSLLVIGDDGLTSDVEYEVSPATETINQLNVRFSDRTRDYKDGTVTADDLAHYASTGEVRTKDIQRPYLTDASQASRQAAEYVRMQSQQIVSGKAMVLVDAVENLLPGNLFKLNATREGLQIVCRCTGLRRPKDDGGKAEIEWESERGIWPTLFVSEPDTPDTPEPDAVPQIAYARLRELPPGLRAGNATELGLLVARPSVGVLTADVYYSADGSSYDDVLSIAAFAVKATVLDDYAATTATDDVTTGIRVSFSGPDASGITTQSDAQKNDDTLLLIVGGEIMSLGTVTALGSGTYRLYPLRARYGSTKETHLTNAVAWIISRASLPSLVNSQFTEGSTRSFKFQAKSLTDEADLSAATVFTYSFGAPQGVIDDGSGLTSGGFTPGGSSGFKLDYTTGLASFNQIDINGGKAYFGDGAIQVRINYPDEPLTFGKIDGHNWRVRANGDDVVTQQGTYAWGYQVYSFGDGSTRRVRIWGGDIATASISGNPPPEYELFIAPGNAQLTLNGCKILSGAGTPEGSVTAPKGSVFIRSDGGAGTTFYVKESGVGNTGWAAK